MLRPRLVHASSFGDGTVYPAFSCGYSQISGRLQICAGLRSEWDPWTEIKCGSFKIEGQGELAGQKPLVDTIYQRVQSRGAPLTALFTYGSVEKSRQRRSRHFSVLTYYTYAPRVKLAAALLDGLFCTDPQSLMCHLILGKFARKPLHYSTLPYERKPFLAQRQTELQAETGQVRERRMPGRAKAMSGNAAAAVSRGPLP